jgi:hypothetical protein
MPIDGLPRSTDGWESTEPTAYGYGKRRLPLQDQTNSSNRQWGASR